MGLESRGDLKGCLRLKPIAAVEVPPSQGLWGLELVAPLPLISLSSLCFCPRRTWNRYPGGMDWQQVSFVNNWGRG